MVEKMKMTTKEQSNINVAVRTTQISALLLYDGVYWRFSQIISVGSDAS